jgi:hypothetical protein
VIMMYAHIQSDRRFELIRMSTHAPTSVVRREIRFNESANLLT